MGAPGGGGALALGGAVAAECGAAPTCTAPCECGSVGFGIQDAKCIQAMHVGQSSFSTATWYMGQGWRCGSGQTHLQCLGKAPEHKRSVSSTAKFV